MSNKISYNEIRNINEDWVLDDRNGYPYSGKSVQDFIKETLNNKGGEFYYDLETSRYLIFANSENRETYLTNRTKYADLVIGAIDIPSNYKAEYDLTNTVLASEIDAENQEYRNGKWWFKGIIKIPLPVESDYGVQISGVEGGDIKIGDNYYSGSYVLITLEDLTELIFEAEDWVGIEHITINERYGRRVPTKLSELTQDIIHVNEDTLIVDGDVEETEI